jgi:hypothetical protein
VAVEDWFAPSVETVLLIGESAAPERPSEHDQLRVTLPPFQPFPFAGVRLTKPIEGSLLSMLNPLCVSLALLPARS